LLRNACVAAGNWGQRSAVPVLADLLHDSEPLVRGHAAWALRQIGGNGASAAINDALKKEQDAQVRRELEA
jgi:epoxyqueuosine reductase